MAAIRHLARLFPLLAAALAVFPSLAAGAWTDFVPRPYENRAALEVFASQENDSSRADGHAQDWSDRFIKEKLTLSSTGYSYHPRFMTYQLSISESLKQEEYDASYFGSGGWKSGSGTEYDAALFFLPEHPYNLKLFSRRTEPVYKEMSATYMNNVGESRGAVFRYRWKPYFFGARYIEDSLKSSLYTTNTKLFGTDGAYFREFRDGKLFSLDAAFTSKRFDASLQGKGDSNEFSIHNTIDQRIVRLDSSLSNVVSRQGYFAGSGLETDQFSWIERLTVNFPRNLKSDLSYTYRKDSFTIGAFDATPQVRTTNNDKRIDLNIAHSLYESLRSRYSFSRDWLSSTGGDTDFVSHSVTFDYTKKIPWGRLTSGLSFGDTVTETSGAATVLNVAADGKSVPGTFSLNVRTIDPGTIRVFLKSPLPPFDLVPLTENVHFTVEPLGDTFQVVIGTLPPEYALPGTYDFLVSYSLVPAGFRLRTDTFAWNVGLDLLENMLNTYYSYRSTKSKVLAGDFPGGPYDTEVHSVGVVFYKDPFRARAEYQRQISDVSPYSQWKGEVTFSKNVTETTRFFASSSYTDTYYSQGNYFDAGPGYGVSTGTVSGNIQQRFPPTNLLLSAGGSYSFFRGQTDGSAYSANAALLWKAGKFSLSLGASTNGSATESSGIGALDTRRTHQKYYLNAKREFY